MAHGRRKGFVLDLDRRSSQIKLPSNTAKPKYSNIPHPLMRLTRLALPSGSQPGIVENAVEKFSASVTLDTQAGYATAARHYIAAEAQFGRKFALPPTDSEMVYLVSYMISRNLSVSTIRSYLAGIRYYLLSLGVARPLGIPPLAEQLLTGLQKGGRNATMAASQKTRRAITVHMLKLLGNAIARSNVWSNYEKSLRWAAVLVAWWGAFRIGELLPKTRSKFDSSSTLLRSDVTFHEESIAFWIRSPKIEHEACGDIVEA